MDVTLSEEQKMIKETARAFLETECPRKLVRAMEADDKGYPPELWKKMADVGWLGLVFPEQYDGTGSNFLDLSILLEELGRALAPVPFVPVVVGALAILAAGSPAQKRELLPRIARGEIILTTALVESNFGYWPESISTTATSQADSYVIEGTKHLVPWAHIADMLLCVCKTAGGGLTLLLVDAKDPSVKITPLESIASDRQYKVAFNKVKVPKSNVIGEVGRGWEVVGVLLRYASVAQSAWLIGGLQQSLDMTVAHAKERVQSGHHIGSYQAIQHRIADMVIFLETARVLVYQSAWKLGKGLPCVKDISMAKAWVNEACERSYASAHQVNGAVAFNRDHDLGLYSRRAKIAQAYWGNTNHHLDVVASELGL